jgi:hypothetical protein
MYKTKNNFGYYFLKFSGAILSAYLMSELFLRIKAIDIYAIPAMFITFFLWNYIFKKTYKKSHIYIKTNTESIEIYDINSDIFQKYFDFLNKDKNKLKEHKFLTFINSYTYLINKRNIFEIFEDKTEGSIGLAIIGSSIGLLYTTHQFYLPFIILNFGLFIYTISSHKALKIKNNNNQYVAIFVKKDEARYIQDQLLEKF